MNKTTLLAMIFSWVLSPWAVAAPVRVGLVLDKGGKDDKSFNSAAYAGATKAQKELGATVKTIAAADDRSFEPLLREFAQKDFDLIVSIGFAQAEALTKTAIQFPNKKFAIVDAEVSLPNVRALLFEEHEGSFLVGFIAGKLTRSNKVGFVGGMDIPLIRRFQMGYEAGVKHALPQAQIVSSFVGVTGDAWNNPAQAKGLASTQYIGGADIVFAAAGASNLGVFDAAEEKKKFAIGVDSNQNWVKPGLILTSMLKRVDVAVYQVIRDMSEGKFSAGTVRHGLKNDGVGYSLDEFNRKLIPAEVLKEVELVKSKIISGKLEVPDFYKRKSR